MTEAIVVDHKNVKDLNHFCMNTCKVDFLAIVVSVLYQGTTNSAKCGKELLTVVLKEATLKIARIQYVLLCNK